MIEEVSVKYIRRNNCSNKSCWNNNQRIFVPAITDGTVVPTMIVVTAVSTRAVETAAKEIFVPAIIVGTIVPTNIVGTAVPTIIVETAYYWKSCVSHIFPYTCIMSPCISYIPLYLYYVTLYFKYSL